MRQSLILGSVLPLAMAAGLAAQMPSAADEPAPPIDEKAIFAEIHHLVEVTEPVSEKRRDEARDLARKGIEAHDAGQYEKAIDLYDRALELDPLDGLFYFEKALTYTTVGDQPKALESCIRAIALAPGLEDAYVQKASILDDLGYPEAALRAYDDLLRRQPKSFPALLNKGITLYRLSRLDEAEKAFLLARDVLPGHPSPYAHLATLAGERGFNYDEVEMLEKFLEVGADDPRRPSVEKRLEELREHKVEIDPTSPFPQIALQEQLARAAWRTKTHRERFPDARGYVLTLAEEEEIYQEIVLPAWREEKEKNPDASHPYYDLVLAVDNAGFFTELVYYTQQNVMGEPARQWLSENPERVEKFLEWARTHGYLREADAPEEAADVAEEEGRVTAQSFLAQVFEITEGSDLVYKIDLGEVSEKDRMSYLKSEAKEFRAKLDLSGENRVTCARKLEEDLNALTAALRTTEELVRILRCHRLDGEGEWERFTQRATRLAVEVRDLSPAIAVRVRRRGDEIAVDGLPPWSAYALTKAAWRNEAQLRVRYSDLEEYRPSVIEEVFALASAIQMYSVLRDSEEGEEPWPEEESFEVLLNVAGRQALEGYALFEILHRRYGLSLESLTPNAAAQVETYLRTFVLSLRSAP